MNTDNAASDRTDSEAKWERAGREAVVTEATTARQALDDALYPLIDEMREGEDPTPEQIEELRSRTGEFLWVLEKLLAPAADLEPWTDTDALKFLPYGVRGQENDDVDSNAGEDVIHD